MIKNVLEMQLQQKYDTEHGWIKGLQNFWVYSAAVEAAMGMIFAFVVAVAAASAVVAIAVAVFVPSSGLLTK